MFYAGIGAREIPEDVRRTLIEIGAKLAHKGYTLRSGAASGADSAFERGCDLLHGSKEIFLPWQGFSDHPSQFFLKDNFYDLEPLAKTIYLGWDTAKIGTKKLHARNIQQVLGEKPGISEPSKFVVCWTNRPKGQFGGTRFGMILAEQRGIPVFNLIEEDEKRKFYEEVME